jgi:precorrin-6y C5,15-methyltransferase (decarboxylating) CbiE subunit
MAATGSGKLMIVGCGPGSPDYLTEAGRCAIRSAQVLVGSPRLLASYATPAHEQVPVGADIDAALDAVAARREQGGIAILVTGDPGLASLAGPVLRRFGRDSCEVIPGVSSVQLAFARLGLDWSEARIVSAHKGIPELVPADLAAFGSIAVLPGHPRSRQWIGDLAEAFGNERFLVVCEELSLPGERIRSVSAAEFRSLELSSRTVVLLLKEKILW